MHDDDELAAQRKKASLTAELENASIGDLEERIERLRAEISQCERMIASKRAQRAAADNVFGARPS